MTERFEGEGAKAYDSRIPLLVPGYELLHQLCASRLMAALAKYKIQAWPYEGPIALVERDEFGMREPKPGQIRRMEIQ